ncbi:MAG: type 1 glutamine amidotransferase [Candidatus Omnitrophica bacterium]|nr:type 1 glutamine amidotransferase [Candidatus Omnitrophota bacterium]MDD5487705.1 type 1 glutamine amidotransferase [Candidatus Omnitrophota bacterium]
MDGTVAIDKVHRSMATALCPGRRGMVLIIKHIEIEGPGIIGEVLDGKDCRIRTVELSRGEALPRGLGGVRAVISLGGPMNVYEEKKYPFLAEEDKLIKEALAKEVPFLGICLGAQLLAKAAGAKVKKARDKEIGFYTVELTLEASIDPVMKGLPGILDVFQWHEDTFDLPVGSVLLASGETSRNQAFRLGKNAYGFQFHLEVDGEMVKNWINEYIADPGPERSRHGARIMEEHSLKGVRLLGNGKRISSNFAALAGL